jgi:hypothetical protein
MGTRGVIARQTGECSFAGRYHHWDSYPDGLGATLFALAQKDGPFGGDLPKMLHVLLDEHPAGWSTINGADWTQPPGYEEDGFKTEGPHCYCHGGRREDDHGLFTEMNASASGCEWAYVFTEARHMLVCSSYRRDGVKMIGAFGVGDPDAVWNIVDDINLDQPPPDWKQVGREPEDQ